ncbi:MAG: MMPL family transporter [Dermatophilus congolensis]|nr:MMPL family transporter [Dermatophilus congolensis]
MSPALFALGRACYRRPGRVAAAWLIVVVFLAALAGLVGKGTSEVYTVPGSESQQALDDVGMLFPEVSRSTGEIVIVSPPSERVDSARIAEAVLAAKPRLEAVPDVATVVVPFATSAASGSAEGGSVADEDQGATASISDDGRAAIITLQVDASGPDVPAVTLDGIRAETARLSSELPGVAAETGGQIFSATAPTISFYEAVGLVLAALVLIVFFRSVRGAVSPIIAAMVTAVVTMLALVAVTSVATLTGTAPMLALMVGIAVGIDYSLFLLSRFRELTREGVPGLEAAARATATAGSAVVFAGLTIITALAGLVIVGLPFLSAMGLSAAFGVAVAVAGAITIGPALMRWLDPLAQRRAAAARERWEAEREARAESRTAARENPRDAVGSWDDEAGDEHGVRPGGDVYTPPQPAWARRWVDAVTRWPLVTVLLVTGVLIACAVPIKDMTYALPSNGTAPVSASERRAYDLVAEHFGPGDNGPLLIVADIVTSTDPLGYMDELKTKLEGIEGVDRVVLSTPNRKADTGIVIAIPTTAPDDPATSDLVQRIREQADDLGGADAHEVRVTGHTAVQIDVSNRLADAMVPFGLVVVGLSLILLLVVFRSFVVPITAAFGFVLSVAAAFGAVGAVFEWGWLAELLRVARVGPVISFLPILLLGVLFGLAMDYQMFLVSRMHEHYAHNRDPKAAVREGFIASAPVVAAAAAIMVGVFAAFVPGGSAVIQPIALGLAVGVFVDAFIVRMIFVPAALMLFGHSAWALPSWLEKRLPHLDVEGHGVAHQIAAEESIAAHPERVVNARGVAVSGPRGEVFSGLDLQLDRGDLCLLTAPEGAGKTSAMLALAGRLPVSAGEIDVAGAVLPEQSSLVQSRAALAEFGPVNGLENHLGLDSHIAERLAQRSLQPWVSRGHIDEVMARFAEACAVAGAPGSVGSGDTVGVGDRRVTPDTFVGDLTRLERAVFGIVLAELGRPQLLCVDDVDTLPTLDERIGLLRLLGSIARGEGYRREAGDGPAVIAAVNHDLDATQVAAAVGLPPECVRAVRLAGASRTAATADVAGPSRLVSSSSER